MAIIVAWVACLFFMVQGLGIATAMEGKIGWVEAFFPTIFIVGLICLPWAFILPLRALRWAWRSIGAEDYFAGR
jgi:hypothetical protein